jgi:hypothetical protein
MKKIITTYTFVPAAKTVQLTGLGSVDIKGLLLITNVTDNIIIYNFADATKGGTAAGNTITLTYDTSLMSSGDNLQIFYDDADYTQPVSASALPLPSGAATLAEQGVLESLIDTLQELIQRLAPIGSWSSSGNAAMRVVGVSMPSTAVTGPATSAQVIAALLTQTLSLMSTNRTVSDNLLVTQANINNAVGV